ncbi:MAG: glycosyltransferase [Sinobacteraceae bacterium]|nr:glycosyltransferase [Nevskiaceae bacterium]
MPALVSIILPCFNRVRYLRAAVQSVLQQSFGDWELLIADDGSDDAETLAYLQRLASTPQVRVLSLPHCGNPPRVRNRALQATDAPFVAFIDSDDLWLPDKLTLQVQQLRTAPVARWSYTDFQLVDAQGTPRAGPHARSCPSVTPSLLEELLAEQTHIAQSSVLIERALLSGVGGYDEQLPICGDYDLWIRLAACTEPVFVAAQLVHVRRHGQHYASDVESLDDLERVLLKTLAAGHRPHLDQMLRRRRARVAASRLRAFSLARERVQLVRSVLGSARYGWPEGVWRTHALSSLLRAFAPVPLLSLLRRRRNLPQHTAR